MRGVSAAVKRPQPSLGICVLLPQGGQRVFDLAQALCIIPVDIIAPLVLALAIVLDPFAAVFYFCQTEGGGGAFEEVPQSGELGEVSGVPTKRR